MGKPNKRRPVRFRESRQQTSSSSSEPIDLDRPIEYTKLLLVNKAIIIATSSAWHMCCLLLGHRSPFSSPFQAADGTFYQFPPDKASPWLLFMKSFDEVRCSVLFSILFQAATLAFVRLAYRHAEEDLLIFSILVRKKATKLKSWWLQTSAAAGNAGGAPVMVKKHTTKRREKEKEISWAKWAWRSFLSRVKLQFTLFY